MAENEQLKGQMSIFDYLAPAELWHQMTGNNDYWQTDIEFKNDIPVCKHSGHTCNKKELFRLAEDMNPFCPHTCCRFCSEKLCGVRCNGATEEIIKVEVKGYMDDGYCPKCNYNLPDLIERCPYCKTLMDWTSWKRINEK